VRSCNRQECRETSIKESNLKLGRAVIGMAIALAIGAGSASAQRFGAQLNWSDDFDFGVGARVELGMPNLFTSSGPLSRTSLVGSFDYFFPDCEECSYWEINGNVTVPITASGVDPYVGAGLNVARFSVDLGSGLGGDASNTEVGLNLLGGLNFQLGRVAAFGEGRLELSGGEQLVLTFGIKFGK
jgi:opacity protein-like surface antigen